MPIPLAAVDRAMIEAEIRRTIQERIDYAVEFRIVWPDGAIHWMSARARYESHFRLEYMIQKTAALYELVRERRACPT